MRGAIVTKVTSKELGVIFKKKKWKEAARTWLMRQEHIRGMPKVTIAAKHRARCKALLKGYMNVDNQNSMAWGVHEEAWL